MSADTFATVQRLLVEGLSVEESKVTPEASLQEDLGADSLDAVELIMTLEEQFGIEIEAEQAEGLKTVADVVTLIDQLAG